MSEKPKHKIWIDYGYDIHSIEVPPEVFEEITSGKLVEVDGQGFFHEEEGFVQDHWVFNSDRGKTYFWIDAGAEFGGDILDDDE